MGILSRINDRRALLAQRSRTTTSPNTWSNYGGPWWPGAVLESFTGAFQTNTVVAPSPTLLSFSAVYACISGIAYDIAKIRMKLVEYEGKIGREIEEAHGNSAEKQILSLLETPNRYQLRIKFIEQWLVSKMLYGNAYILKQRDANRTVTGLYVLHPACVKELVGDDGSRWFELDVDNLTGIEERIVVPPSEMIHDSMVALWHPLVGVSPLYACSTSATLGTSIQANAKNFWTNRSLPGGMLTAIGHIHDDTAARLKTAFEANFSGDNIGRLFVAGDGLEFKPFGWNNEQAQLIDQLRWAVEDVARAFRYPLFKLNSTTPPYANGPQSAQLLYYMDCLQWYIESIEDLLKAGLGIKDPLSIEFDLDGLLRMDSSSTIESVQKAIQASVMSPNEGREKLGLEPVEGGEAPLSQKQYYPLNALAAFHEQELEKMSEPPEPPAPPQLPASTEPPPEPAPTPEPPAAEDRMTLTELQNFRSFFLGESA